MTNKDQAEKLRGILGRTFYDRENDDIDYLYEVARERLAQLEAEPADGEALLPLIASIDCAHDRNIREKTSDTIYCLGFMLKDYWPTIRRALTQARGWQPIETAPKDGTEILIFRNEWNVAPIAKWYCYDNCPDDEGNGIAVWGWAIEDGYYLGQNADGFIGWNDDPMPTHWMPRPCAPQPDKGE